MPGKMLKLSCLKARTHLPKKTEMMPLLSVYKLNYPNIF